MRYVLLLAALLAPAGAQAQSFPGQLPANQFLAGPASAGPAAPPTGRAIVAADLPLIASNNVLGNPTGSPAPPTAFPIFSTTNPWTASQTFSGGFTGGGPVSMINSATPGSFTTPGYNFNDNGIVGFSFADTSTHYAFTIGGNSPATGTGSYAGLNVTQFGAGRTTSAFVTGATLQAIAIGGSGNITGSNPYVVICGTAVVAGQCPNGTAATVASAVGEEVDIFSNAGATILYKEGIRIADLGVVQATGTGHLSAGIVMVRNSTSPGFDYGLYFGDPTVTDNSWPLTTTGSGIKFGPTSHAIDSLIDASATLTAGITTAAFKLPDNVTVVSTPTWKFLMTSTVVAFQTQGSGINAAILSPNSSVFSGFVESGNPGTNPGAVVLLGQTSGSVTIQPGGAAAGTFNFNLPITPGSSGDVLLSGGGGGNAMVWRTGVTTVCTVTVGNTLTFTNGILTVKGANCT